MLKITVPAQEYFDETTQTFHYINETTLQLEHSLLSLSKWEAKWNVPFLSESERTDEQLRDYIRFMTINAVNPLVYYGLGQENIRKITEYISAPMTATTITDRSPEKKKSKQIVTSEIIYYWMIALNIPFECQKWHLNRLLTLIQVCNIKNNPDKKMSKKDRNRSNRALNEQRRNALNTKG